jgi:uncharacterized membrane protein
MPPEEAEESSTITVGSITGPETAPAKADDAASERAAARAIDFIVSSKNFACGLKGKVVTHLQAPKTVPRLHF